MVFKIDLIYTSPPFFTLQAHASCSFLKFVYLNMCKRQAKYRQFEKTLECACVRILVTPTTEGQSV